MHLAASAVNRPRSLGQSPPKPNLREWAGGNEIPRLIAGVWVSANEAAQELVIQVDVLFQINFKLLICIYLIRCTQAV
jgi:hypothetical protein